MVIAAALAQVPDPKSYISTGLTEILRQGTLGVLCVLLIIALYFSIKALLRAKDDNIEAQKSMAEALRKLNEAARDFTIEMNKSMTNMVTDNGRSSEKIATSLAKQEQAFHDLTQEFRLAERLGGKK